MNGILEAILAELQAIRVVLSNPAQLAPAPAYTPHAAPAMPATPAYTTAAPATTTPPPQTITADSILALIQPHIGDDATKAQLGAAMRAMGINALPETQPHQFAELYARFQQVLAAHAAQAAPAQSTSII